MDEKLKQLTQELGQAIDQAINESTQVKDLTEQLRAAGYETILMVEATICFARRSLTLGGETKIEMSEELANKMNRDDLQFLKSLKISVEDLDDKE